MYGPSSFKNSRVNNSIKFSHFCCVDAARRAVSNEILEKWEEIVEINRLRKDE